MSHITVSLPPDVEKAAQKWASRKKVSLDEFCRDVLIERVLAFDREGEFHQRAARGNRQEFDRVLNQVPDQPE